MRFRTLEIRWHDSKPISTCDFQPVPFKRARPPSGAVGGDERFASHSYRLATGGEDNHVRIWMVYPNIRPTSLVKDDPNPAAPRPPRIEYLSTLSRHSAPVNVVRFSPNGELIASAGDDGMIIIWAQSTNPHASAYGSDIPPDELQLDKEFWKPRTTLRCTTMQVYDLAWSPMGEYIIAGSTDNTARVFASIDGKCVCEIAEHSHFVQGVAWDPLNEYIATQSSDRSMHVYRISTKNGIFEAHGVGRNTRMPTRHVRTPSAHGQTRPKMFRTGSSTSDADSAIIDDNLNTPLTPVTSVTNTPSFTAGMFPPPPIVNPSSATSSSVGGIGTGLGGGTGGGGGGGGPSSRRSSFSASSNAAGSPHSSIRYGGRSPSPMPPLPAIRSLPPSAQMQWANVKLYGDESFTNFFRRLTFSPDGALLLTPAGQFEDPIIIPSSLSHKGGGGGSSAVGKEEPGVVGAGATTPVRGRKGRPSVITEIGTGSSTSISTSPSSVYIYSRANFARPPIAQLPGHKKASVAVRFSPILYELRPGIEIGGDRAVSGDIKPATATLEKGTEGTLDVDVAGPMVIVSPPTIDTAATSATPTSISSSTAGGTAQLTPLRTPATQTQNSSIVSPAPKLALTTQLDTGAGVGGSQIMLPSPGLSPMDLRPPTPLTSKPSTPSVHNHNQPLSHVQMQTQGGASSSAVIAQSPAVHPGNGVSSIFALPYRMLYAVVTMDAVVIYDTQQAGPVCLLTKLHYDEFTDMTWSPDGQTLLLSSRDGYCTIIIFDEILLASHTQQHALQLQSIAHQNSVPLVSSNSTAAAATTGTSTTNTPAMGNIALPPPLSITSMYSGNTTHVGTGLAYSHVSTPSSAFAKKRSEPPLTPGASTDGSDIFFLNPAPTIAAAGPMVSGTPSLPKVSDLTTGSVSDLTRDTKNITTPVKASHKRQLASGTDESARSNPTISGESSTDASGTSGKGEQHPHKEAEPPKKKRRVALTRVGELDS